MMTAPFNVDCENAGNTEAASAAVLTARIERRVRWIEVVIGFPCDYS
jgi:hypothetical protein